VARVTSVHVAGLKELDEALGELTKATARNVLKRALARGAKPVLDEAKRRAPVRTGELLRGLHIRTQLINTVGNREYSAAMRAGLGKAAALKALRAARREAPGTGSFAEVYVQTGRNPQSVFQESGTAHHAAQPYLGPALDAKGNEAIKIIAGAIGEEIDKAAARAARKAARAAAKANTTP
jgi:HK97 gp10 family phage protein